MGGPKKKKGAGVPSSSGRIRTIGPDSLDKHLRIKNPSLKDTHPRIASEWGRNGLLTPRHVTYGSGYVVDWICKDCKLSWKARVQTRTKGSSCPFCIGRKAGSANSISALDKTAAIEFDLKLNDGKRPEEIAATLKEERYNFRCSANKKHGLYRRTPYARVIQKKGCPSCFEEASRKANAGRSLAVLEPFVAMQWHKERNQLTPFDFTTGSNRKAWFHCEYGHESYLRICDKVRRQFCSRCINEVGRKMARERKKAVWKTRTVKQKKPGK